MPIDDGKDPKSPLSLRRHDDVTPVEVTVSEGDGHIVEKQRPHRMRRTGWITRGTAGTGKPVVERFDTRKGASGGHVAEYSIKEWLARNVAYIL